MVQQVAHVILHEKPERHRLARADAAGRLQLRSRQVRDDVREIAIVAGPERDQLGPWGFLNPLHPNTAVLVVAGKFERALERRPHKALVVVRSRINQVAQDLPTGPAALQDRCRAVFIANLP